MHGNNGLSRVLFARLDTFITSEIQGCEIQGCVISDIKYLKPDTQWHVFTACLTLRPAQNDRSNVLFQTLDTRMSNTHKLRLKSLLKIIARVFVGIFHDSLSFIFPKTFIGVFSAGTLTESEFSNNNCRSLIGWSSLKDLWEFFS